VVKTVHIPLVQLAGITDPKHLVTREFVEACVARALDERLTPDVLTLKVAGDAGTFLLPIKPGAINDLAIDWGDGSSETLEAPLADDNGLAHVYASRADPYTITLTGTTHLAGPYTEDVVVDSALVTRGNYGALGFGFIALPTSVGVSGCNVAENRAKIVGVGGSPFRLLPKGLVTDEPATTDLIGACMLAGCPNLTFDDDFSATGGLSHLTRVGDNFMKSAFSDSGGSALNLPPGFGFPPNLVEVGSFFLLTTFARCNLVPSAGFTIPRHIAKVGNGFMRLTFYNPETTSLQSLPFGFNLPQGIVGDVGDEFLRDTFNGCNGAAFNLPVGFNLPPGVTEVGDYFMRGTFYACNGAAFTLPAGFNLPPGIAGGVGIEFMRTAFYYCNGAAFTLPAGFNIPPGIAEAGVDFLCRTFQVCNNANFRVSAEFRFPVVDTAIAGVFDSTFQSVTATQSITAAAILNGNAVPPGDRNTFAGATGFSDQASLDPYWR
jgi:hypothetical protein